MKIEFSDREIEQVKTELRSFKDAAPGLLEGETRVVQVFQGLALDVCYSWQDEHQAIKLLEIEYIGGEDSAFLIHSPFFIHWHCELNNVPQLKDAIAEVFDKTT